MCGRYTTVSRIEAIEKRFDAHFEKPGLYMPNPNLSPGERAPVITDERPEVIQFFRFGMTPFWAKKRMYLINARKEGDHNKENDPSYSGAAGILQKPSFRKPIRSQRCLILADGFIEGPEKEKLSKPYYVHMRGKEALFAMAGIWDHWADPQTGEIIYSFSIITTTANELLQEIGHHRSPLILPVEMEREWIDPSRKADELLSALGVYPASKMNAWPISPEIRSPGAKDLQLLQPISDPVYREVQYRVVEDLRLQGMGNTSARIRRRKEEDENLD
jgi:putative SOS response-associated peptidase YedK